MPRRPSQAKLRSSFDAQHDEPMYKLWTAIQRLSGEETDILLTMLTMRGSKAKAKRYQVVKALRTHLTAINRGAYA